MSWKNERESQISWKNERESQISSGPSVNIHNSTFSEISGNIATIDDKTGTISGGMFDLELSALKKSDSIQKKQSLPSIPKS
ncbi:14870_t:CDS:1, partial [Acaulospora colombiana]